MNWELLDSNISFSLKIKISKLDTELFSLNLPRKISTRTHHYCLLTLSDTMYPNHPTVFLVSWFQRRNTPYTNILARIQNGSILDPDIIPSRYLAKSKFFSRTYFPEFTKLLITNLKLLLIERKVICRFWQGFDSEYVLCSTILMYIVLNFCLNRILYEPNSYVLHILTI